jgi:membrane dipeptidase
MEEFLHLDPEQEEKAQVIHEQAIIIDGLCYMSAPDDDTYPKAMIKAGVTATNVTIPEVLDNFDQSVRRIAAWYQSISTFSDHLIHALSVDDIYHAKEEGKTTIIMGFQDTKPIENEFKLLDVFHQLGIRIIQLTYQYQNFVGCGCGEKDTGLSAFGRDLVMKLNDLGILIDLSHCGPKTAMGAIELTAKPVAFTHAGVLALCNHVRNKSDELIKAVSEIGGLIGIPSYSQFLDIRATRMPSIVEYLDVIEYVINLVGIDHVALGFDFTPTWSEDDYNKSAEKYPEIYLDYSFENTPLKGLHDIREIINVTRGLITRGYNEESIQKVLGENFLRVFAEVWN